MRIAENLRDLFPKRGTVYLLARNGLDDDPPYYEVCNREALISRLAKYFGDGPIREIQVIRINDESPFFEEIDEEELRKMHDSYKRNLEQRLASA